MIHLKIDNKDIQVPEGTTILEAAAAEGIRIPTMCHLKGHSNHPSCMVCLVMDRKSGALIPSCAHVAMNGMELSTDDQEVLTARRQSLELLMSDHVGDCEAPCSLACPAGMDIPQMNRLLGEGRFTDALNVVKEEIALPYILGYICPAPCEKACRRKQVDEAVSICLLKRISASSGNDERSRLAAITAARNQGNKRRKVAIIGSGPAGLAAAYYLQLYGHSCIILEKSAGTGGTLRHSISREDLPAEVIDEEVKIIRSMGASFVFNTTVDIAFYNSEIKNIYDAVIVATGDISSSNHLAGLFDMSSAGIKVNDRNMSTSVPGIFVCGSAIRTHKMAVRSVAQGKTAADSVNNYLQGKEFEKAPKMFNSRFEKLFEAEYDEYLKESVAYGRRTPVSGYAGGFSESEAIEEAKRCLHCDCRKKDNCTLRLLSDEYNIERKRYLTGQRKTMKKQFQHSRVVFEPEKCIKCGLCVEISGREGEKWGLAFEGRGFDVCINAPLGTGFEEGLTHAAIKCAELCPTGSLSLRDKNSG